MKDVNPVALFRLSVLGPLVSREYLARGELKAIIRELAGREYAIPGSDRRHVGEKTIEAWLYAFRRGGIDALTPKTRRDHGVSQIPSEIQEAILAAKGDNPRRSIRMIRQLLESTGRVPRGSLSRSSIHRLLRRNGLSRIQGNGAGPEERRSFTAEYAGSLWYGDVLHGPKVPFKKALHKAYLVSLFDDASRLPAFSAFCFGETALDIEGVLKQAVLRRGLPKKLVVDNGAAYRSATLQGICARLGIHLVYCRPYDAPSKGKLERWHRTLRAAFLSELDMRHIAGLADLNARLWAWIEQVYNLTPHSGINGATPLTRYQQDLARIRPLGALAPKLDEIFWHRVRRYVRKDGTVSYQGRRFEVPYPLAGQTVHLVVDPHKNTVEGVEDQEGGFLGRATPLDLIANNARKRHKPAAAAPQAVPPSGPNLVEIAHRRHYGPKEG